jgi:hypothetical protein
VPRNSLKQTDITGREKISSDHRSAGMHRANGADAGFVWRFISDFTPPAGYVAGDGHKVHRYGDEHGPV